MDSKGLCVLFVILLITQSHSYRIKGPVPGLMICQNVVHGTKLPNNNDCGSFYVCTLGVAQLILCDEGLHFDRKINVCNWPEYAQCVLTTDPSPSTPSSTLENNLNESNFKTEESTPDSRPSTESLTSPPTTEYIVIQTNDVLIESTTIPITTQPEDSTASNPNLPPTPPSTEAHYSTPQPTGDRIIGASPSEYFELTTEDTQIIGPNNSDSAPLATATSTSAYFESSDPNHSDNFPTAQRDYLLTSETATLIPLDSVTVIFSSTETPTDPATITTLTKTSETPTTIFETLTTISETPTTTFVTPTTTSKTPTTTSEIPTTISEIPTTTFETPTKTSETPTTTFETTTTTFETPTTTFETPTTISGIPTTTFETPTKTSETPTTTSETPTTTFETPTTTSETPTTTSEIPTTISEIPTTTFETPTKTTETPTTTFETPTTTSKTPTTTSEIPTSETSTISTTTSAAEIPTTITTTSSTITTTTTVAETVTEFESLGTTTLIEEITPSNENNLPSDTTEINTEIPVEESTYLSINNTPPTEPTDHDAKVDGTSPQPPSTKSEENATNLNTEPTQSIAENAFKITDTSEIDPITPTEALYTTGESLPTPPTPLTSSSTTRKPSPQPPTKPTARPTPPKKKPILPPKLHDYDPNHIRCLHDGLYFLPHPTKCELYFICASRNLTMHHCGVGVHWDYLIEQCAISADSRCYFNDFEPIMQPTTTTSVKPTTHTTAIISSPTPPMELLPKCPPYQSFIPYKRDCRKYYICIGGLPILTSCPDNLYWDSKGQFCGDPAKTECLMKQ